MQIKDGKNEQACSELKFVARKIKATVDFKNGKKQNEEKYAWKDVRHLEAAESAL